MQRQVSIKSDWKEVPGVEILKIIELLILIVAYKPENTTLLQLWGQENDCPLFNKIMNHQLFQTFLRVLHFEFTSARREIRSDEKLEPSRDVF